MPSTQDYTAYDYEAQEWRTGAQAKALLIEQLRAEISLLDSPDGRNYFEYCKRESEQADESTFEEYLADLRKFLEDLEGK